MTHTEEATQIGRLHKVCNQVFCTCKGRWSRNNWGTAVSSCQRGKSEGKGSSTNLHKGQWSWNLGDLGGNTPWEGSRKTVRSMAGSSRSSDTYLGRLLAGEVQRFVLLCHSIPSWRQPHWDCSKRSLACLDLPAPLAGFRLNHTHSLASSKLWVRRSKPCGDTHSGDHPCHQTP